MSKCFEYAKNSTLIQLPKEDKAHMLFKNHKNKVKRPYIVYADIECSLVPTGLVDKIYFVCDDDPTTQNRVWYVIGPNSIVHMLVELAKLSDECISKMKKNQDEDERNGHVGSQQGNSLLHLRPTLRNN